MLLRLTLALIEGQISLEYGTSDPSFHVAGPAQFCRFKNAVAKSKAGDDCSPHQRNVDLGALLRDLDGKGVVI